MLGLNYRSFADQRDSVRTGKVLRQVIASLFSLSRPVTIELSELVSEVSDSKQASGADKDRWEEKVWDLQRSFEVKGYLQYNCLTQNSRVKEIVFTPVEYGIAGALFGHLGLTHKHGVGLISTMIKVNDSLLQSNATFREDEKKILLASLTYEAVGLSQVSDLNGKSRT